MKVIICEDERYWRDTINKSISQWAANNNIEVQCSCFASPREMINVLTNQSDVDALVLDISLGEEEINGMVLAMRIRKMNISIPIIFITSDAQKAADGYLVEAMGFLSKPIDEKRLFLYLDRIIAKQKKQKKIRILTDGHLTNIEQNDILFVEVLDHTVTYHTTQGKISHRGTLRDVLDKVDKNDFVQIHRSYVIATDKIKSIKSTYPYTVSLLSHKEAITLPVSRKYIDFLMNAFSDDLWELML